MFGDQSARTTHELPAAQERFDQNVEGVDDPKPVERSANRSVCVVDCHTSMDRNTLRTTVLLKSPAPDLAYITILDALVR